MKKNILYALCVIVPIGLSLGTSLVQAAPPGYNIIDLGTLAGSPPYFSSKGLALNNIGQVVGSAQQSNGYTRAFIYDNNIMTDLGTLGGRTSVATGINNMGLVVGGSEYLVPDSPNHAFQYDGTTMIDLGTLGGASSDAHAVNDAGQIVGRAYNSNSEFRAFLYDSGVMNDLGTLGGAFSSAVDINSTGQIVGSSALAGGSGSDGKDHAFIYENGIMSDIGTLGGYFSAAQAINDAGQIVGYSSTTGPVGVSGHAFIYEDGTMTDLGTMGFTGSKATDINNDGWVVGDIYDEFSQPNRAFLFNEEEGMLDLYSLISDTDSDWEGLTYASAINDNGQITGWGTIASQVEYEGDLITVYSTHGFLMSPVPIPASFLLFGSGLIGLIGVARRKKA